MGNSSSKKESTPKPCISHQGDTSTQGDPPTRGDTPRDTQGDTSTRGNSTGPPPLSHDVVTVLREANRKTSVTAVAPCKYFAMGRCIYGDRCRYFHDLSIKESSTQGLNESEATPRPVADIPSSSPPKPRTVSSTPRQLTCKYFVKGHCFRGASCSFAHPVPSHEGNLRDVIAELASETKGPGVDDTQNGGTPLPNPQPTQSENGTTLRTSNVEHRTNKPVPIPESKKYGCRVQYGDGMAIRQITTAFESQDVILSKFPSSASREDLDILATRFGDLESLTMDKQADDHPIARLKYADVKAAIDAVCNLDGNVFQSHTLAARFDVRAVEDGNSVLRSTKVRMSWFAPTRKAQAHYSDTSTAQRQAEKLNGAVINGRKILASFNLRSTRSCSSYFVTLKHLPSDISETHLCEVCEANFVTIEQPNYDYESALQEIRSMLSSSVALEKFDPLPFDSRNTKVVVFAQFRTSDDAERAVKQYNRVPQGFLNKGFLTMDHIHTIKYIVPLGLLKVIRPEIDVIRGLQQDVKYRCYEKNGNGVPLDPAIVWIESTKPDSLNKVRAAMELVLSGDLFFKDGREVWDDYFRSRDAMSFLRGVQERTSAFVKCDVRSRTLRLYGTPEAKDAAKVELSLKLAALSQREYTVHIEKTKLEAVVTNGALQDVFKKFGADKVVLDTPQRTITIRGEKTETDQIRRAVGDALGLAMFSQPGGECPVCFCEPTDPVKLSCGHPYCKGCLQHLLRSTPAPSATSIKCVSETLVVGEGNKPCTSDIPYTVIRSLLTRSEEDNLLEAIFLSHIHSRPDEFRYCPTPDCQIVFRTQKDGSVLRCPSCLARICASCHVEFHEGQVCAEYRDHISGGNEAYRKWREQNGVKACPTCKADMEKAGGCNHMTCVRCSTHMCWVCMKTFGETDTEGGVYEHMRNVHGSIG